MHNIKFCLPVAVYTSVFDVVTVNYAIKEDVSLKVHASRESLCLCSNSRGLSCPML